MLNKKALAGTPSTPPVFVEDVFNTWVYTLDSANTTYTIQNNIDLSTKGGLVWFKPRSQPSSGNGQHCLFDTVRGSSPTNQRMLNTNQTSAQTSGAGDSVQFNANGFTAVYEDGASNLFRTTNNFGQPYNQCVWTFREQPKFFDVVTYTGDGTTDRNVAHNLGSQPGMVIVKAVDGTSDWNVRHIGAGTSGFKLNTTAAGENIFGSYNTSFTSTTFYVTSTNVTYDSFNTNRNGVQYVAYLFAHNAGGFGTAGTDNVISCGSYTGNGSATGPTVTLGYEPQWLLIKQTNSANDWILIDNMRGFPVSPGQTAYLNP